jgi:tocopherol O-methyltransferase
LSVSEPAAAGPTPDAGLHLDRTVEDLHRAIRDHYDSLIELYERLWGEHIHHGYWDPGAAAADRHEAQVRMVHEVAEFAEIPTGARVLDSGCGIGAAAIMLAAERDCAVTGITLSEEQVRRATDKATAAGVADRASFRLADALRTGFADATFDVVLALESCELMPDKAAFLRECHRVLRPGGRLVVATWCSRDDRLTPGEVRLLRRIYRDFAVAYVLPLGHYEQLCAQTGYVGVRSADWTEFVRNTWAVSTDLIKPFVRDPTFIWKLVRAKGVDTFRFLNSLPLMKQAYDRGVMRYGVFCATRPE